MDANRLHDLISRSMGNAARVIGEDYDLFRSTASRHPLAAANRIMRLPVVLSAGSGRKAGGDFTFEAIFDSVSAGIGDYLRGPRGVLFVSSLQPFGTPSCVLTDRAVDVLRSNRAPVAGLGGYGGITEDTLDMILEDWPVCFRSKSGGGSGGLPADGGRTSATVLFPRTPVAICASDLLQDAFGRRFVVRVAEELESGWLLSVLGTEV